MPRRRADILFSAQKVAVFVDGCFWHCCPRHSTRPSNNSAWWEAKLTANAVRDRDTNERLEAAGWQVVRIWEHECLDDAIAKVVQHLPPRPVP